MFLCVAVFAMPWEETVKIVGNSRLPALAATSACLAAVIAVAITRQLRPLSLFHAVAIAFLSWGVLSLFWSVDSGNTLARSATYAQLVLMTWLVWQFSADPARQRELMQAFVLGAFFTAGDMIRNYMHGVRYVSVEGYEHESFTSGLFRPNDVAFMLVLALPMAWYLAVRRGRGPLMWLNRIYVPVGMVGIFLTASRGALIPAIFALSIIPLTMGKMKLRSRMMTAALAVLVVPVTIAVVPQTSWDRLATTKSDLESGTMTHRRDIWRAGFEVFNQHPMAGVGPGNYEIAAGAYLDRPRPAHNAFLAVLVEQGTIGFLLFCALFVVGLKSLKYMPSLERRFWIILLFTLAIGLLPRNWDYKKPTWFVLAIFASAAASAAEAARAASASERRERMTFDARTTFDGPPDRERWDSEGAMSRSTVGVS
jgi:O-antigen ligase